MSGTSDDIVNEKNVQLLSIVWERIILDEAHQIRNPKSQTALAVCKYEKKGFVEFFFELRFSCFLGSERQDGGR